MTRPLWLVVFASFLLWLNPPSGALASDDEARGLYLAGAAAYGEGRYEDALRYFEQAYDLSQRPGLLYNIGQAADRLRMDGRAIEAFEGFLSQVPEGPDHEAVQMRVHALKRAVQRRQEEAARERVKEGGAAEPVASPEQAAQTEFKTDAEAGSVLQSVEREEEHEGGLLGKWWLWTAVGAVVVGTTVGIVLATGSSTKDADPVPANSGFVVSTFR